MEWCCCQLFAVGNGLPYCVYAMCWILEEVICRGFLFVSVAKDNVKSAIIISSVTFGVGHLINLYNSSGMDLAANLCQICFASVKVLSEDTVDYAFSDSVKATIYKVQCLLYLYIFPLPRYNRIVPPVLGGMRSCPYCRCLGSLKRLSLETRGSWRHSFIPLICPRTAAIFLPCSAPCHFYEKYISANSFFPVSVRKTRSYTSRIASVSIPLS